MVGEVIYLELGDMIPADGILIDRYNVKCNKSLVIGESVLLRKTSGDEAYRAVEQNKDLKNLDPFIISGAKVEEGLGTFLVTATSFYTIYSRTIMSL